MIRHQNVNLIHERCVWRREVDDLGPFLASSSREDCISSSSRYILFVSCV